MPCGHRVALLSICAVLISVLCVSVGATTTSNPGTTLQGPNVYAGLYIKWPKTARSKVADYLTNKNDGTNAPANNMFAGAVTDGQAQIAYEILNWLEVNVYNVNCGNTIDNSGTSTYLENDAALWPWNQYINNRGIVSPTYVNKDLSTTSCGMEGGGYGTNVQQSGPAGKLIVGSAGVQDTYDYIFLAYQVSAQSNPGVANYKIRRTLCLSVNDISRLTTWGAYRYGWTSADNGGGVQFICDPAGQLGPGFVWFGLPNARNCQCGDPWMEPSSTKTESKLGSYGLWVSIILGVAFAVSLCVNCYAVPRSFVQRQGPPGDSVIDPNKVFVQRAVDNHAFKMKM